MSSSFYRDDPNHEAALGSKRVLIIDPTSGMRESLRQMLGSFGITRCTFAKTAKEAVFQFSQEKEVFDAVFCEHYLGGETDGQQLLERVRKTRTLPPSCTFVVITSDPSYQSVAMAAEFSPDEILLKPVTLSLLRERLIKVFSRKEALWPAHRYLQIKPDWESARVAARSMVDTPGFRFRLEACRLLMEAYLGLNQYNEALDHCNKTLEWCETSWGLAGKAKALMGLGDRDGAIRLLEHSIKNHPLFLSSYDLLAEILLPTAPAQAQSILEQALQVSPAIHRQRLLVRTELMLNQRDHVERNLQQIVERNRFGFFKEISDFSELAQIKLQKGEAAAAKQVGDALFDQMKPTPQVMLSRCSIDAGVAAHQRQASEVQRLYEMSNQLEVKIRSQYEASGAQVDHVTVQIELAKLASLAGDHERSSAIIQELVANNHENPEILQSARRAAETVGSKDLIDIVERTRLELLELNNTAVRMGCTGTSENLAKAIQLLDGASDRYRGNISVHNNAAAAHISRCRSEGANETDLKAAAYRLACAYRINPSNNRHAELSSAWGALAGRTWSLEEASEPG